MFKTNATGATVDNHYQNKDTGGGIAGTEIDADDGNITQDELTNAVESGSQTLDPTGADRSQLAKAIGTIAGTAQYHTAGGVLNAYTLTPINSDVLYPPLGALLNGYMVVAFFGTPNTGACTIDWNGEGVEAVIKGAGTPLTGGELDGWCYLWYSFTLNGWYYMYTASTVSILNGSVTMEKLSDSAVGGENVQDRVAKAWVSMDARSGVPLIGNSLNIDSITDNGTGKLTVNILVDMPNTTYVAVAGGSRYDGDFGSNADHINASITGVGTVYMETWRDGSTHADFDQVTLLVISK